MSALRTIKCPNCGQRHYIGDSCHRREEPKPKPLAVQISASVVVIALMALAFIGIAVALYSAYGQGTALAIVIGWLFVLQLFRLGYEWEDGIDVRVLFFPAPYDWSVKMERLVHFWTNPRAWFRLVYIASVIGTIVTGILLAKQGKP